MVLVAPGAPRPVHRRHAPGRELALRKRIRCAISPARVHVVVHHHATLTLEEAEQVIALGADGVFLISYEGQDVKLPPLVAELAVRWHGVRTRRGERPLLGMNLLETQSLVALEGAAGAGANALWVSMPGVTSAGVTPNGRRLAEAMSRWPGIVVFGCVAFKYQPEEKNPPAAAAAALALGMHPTTSGADTALAPDLTKIEAMSRAVGGRLAIASGVIRRMSRTTCRSCPTYSSPPAFLATRATSILHD